QVKLWAVGNEVYGPWERCHVDSPQYAENVKAFAADIRAVDPTVKVVAQSFTADYSKRLLELCGPDIDYNSVHHYSDDIDANTDRERYLKVGRSFHEHL